MLLGCGSSSRDLARKQAALEAAPFFSSLGDGDGIQLLKGLARSAVLKRVPVGQHLDNIAHGTFIVVVEGELVHTELRQNSDPTARRASIIGRNVDKVASDPNADVMATRKVGDFFRLAGAPGGSKASKLADLSRITAVEKTTLLLLTPAAVVQAIGDMGTTSENHSSNGFMHILQEMVRQDISALIEQVPCFKPLDKRVRYTLAQLFSYEVLQPKSTVFAEGEWGDGFVILIHGELDVLQGGKKLATRVSGAFLGEIALLYNCERTATVECGDKVRPRFYRLALPDLLIGGPPFPPPHALADALLARPRARTP